MKRGFTLLELVVVVIILGILATLGFTQYTKMVEKGRTAEAKMILGQIRTAQQAYTQQYNVYTSDLTALAVDAPTACTSTHYFAYSASGIVGSTAARCTAAGKVPDVGTSYMVNLYYGNGVWGGSAGYY